MAFYQNLNEKGLENPSFCSKIHTGFKYERNTLTGYTMAFKLQNKIRNVAIIAHVDHGKTTLIDAMLKQSKVFRDNESVGELIMDMNPLERERGITILSKNTSIVYGDTKINIIDTPGHADFSGEVERILNMVDGCLLLVDAVDGPMPQTRFVLKAALENNVTPVVIVNKIDRAEKRPNDVVDLIQDLFLDLAVDDNQLDFPVVYASARDGYATLDPRIPADDLDILFKTIIETVPPPSYDDAGGFQLLAAALDYDNYVGQIVIGRISRGMVAVKDEVALLHDSVHCSTHKVEKLLVFEGLTRTETNSAIPGDIVGIAGLNEVTIGDTICSTEHIEALPPINFEEPTVKMSFGINTSPFMGKEGKNCTSRTLYERLVKELRTNVSLRVEHTESADSFLVSGRGELHLAILVETLRREEYEFQVSKPQPVLKTFEGAVHEPFELLEINTTPEFTGPLTEYLNKHLGRCTKMDYPTSSSVSLEYEIPTRGLIGFGSFFLKTTHGEGIYNSRFTEYRTLAGQIKEAPQGLLVAAESGIAVTNGLLQAQGRGQTFISPGTNVYQGMVVGKHNRTEEIAINVCKEKKLTNMRQSSSDVAEKLNVEVKMSLEETLDFMSDDDLLEVTPVNYRLRKQELDPLKRSRNRRR